MYLFISCALFQFSFLNTTDIRIISGIVNFRSKDFTAAVKDLSICLKEEKDNKSAYTYLVRLLSIVIIAFQSNYERKCFHSKTLLIFAGTSICFSG